MFTHSHQGPLGAVVFFFTLWNLWRFLPGILMRSVLQSSKLERERWLGFGNIVDMTFPQMLPPNMGVTPESHISHQRRKGEGCGQERKDGEDEEGAEQAMGANINGFSFWAIEMQKVSTHPHCCLLQAGVELKGRGAESGGNDLEVELCVVVIAT